MSFVQRMVGEKVHWRHLSELCSMVLRERESEALRKMKEKDIIQSLLFRKAMAEDTLARKDLSPKCVKSWVDELNYCTLRLKELGYE